LSSDVHRKTLGAKSTTLFNNIDEFKNFYVKATIPSLSRYSKFPWLRSSAIPTPTKPHPFQVLPSLPTSFSPTASNAD
jgi:hypothetical protein